MSCWGAGCWELRRGAGNQPVSSWDPAVLAHVGARRSNFGALLGERRKILISHRLEHGALRSKGATTLSMSTSPLPVTCISVHMNRTRS